MGARPIRKVELTLLESCFPHSPYCVLLVHEVVFSSSQENLPWQFPSQQFSLCLFAETIGTIQQQHHYLCPGKSRTLCKQKVQKLKFNRLLNSSRRLASRAVNFSCSNYVGKSQVAAAAPHFNSTQLNKTQLWALNWEKRNKINTNELLAVQLCSCVVFV